MKTRTQLWKQYREEIEKNINLHKVVINSNKKLGVLYKRLIDVFPGYETKFKSTSKKHNIVLEKVVEPKLPSNEKLNALLDELEELETTVSGLSLLDEINFHSRELQDVIYKFNKGKIKTSELNKQDRKFKTQEIKVNKPQSVNIGANMKKINIAIDGPSGSGKSSAAKAVAKLLGYKYINTGLVYRAIALHCINEHIDVTDELSVTSSLDKTKIVLLENEKVILNGEDVSKDVRSDHVSKAASIVASIGEVRTWSVKLQQTLAQDKGVVMDGRDTTFVVLPEAELKIYLETDAGVRATRRVEQNKVLGFSTNYEEILAELEERDYRDKNRKQDPLHRVADAILIDSSQMSLKQVIEKVNNLAKDLLKGGN